MLVAVYRKFALFFVKSVALGLTILCSILFFMVYLYGQTTFFYYVTVGLWAITVYLALSLSMDYKKLLALNWLETENKDLEECESDDLALKICFYYSHGATYNQLKHTFNLKDNTQVLRLIHKGLKTLIKNYGTMPDSERL